MRVSIVDIEGHGAAVDERGASVEAQEAANLQLYEQALLQHATNPAEAAAGYAQLLAQPIVAEAVAEARVVGRAAGRLRAAGRACRCRARAWCRGDVNSGRDEKLTTPRTQDRTLGVRASACHTRAEEATQSTVPSRLLRASTPTTGY